MLGCSILPRQRPIGDRLESASVLSFRLGASALAHDCICGEQICSRLLIKPFPCPACHCEFHRYPTGLTFAFLCCEPTTRIFLCRLWTRWSRTSSVNREEIRAMVREKLKKGLRSEEH